jgi:ribonuclease HI
LNPIVKSDTSGKTLTVQFDGLCEPVNPGGIATYGFVVIEDCMVIHRGKGVVGDGEGMTNNVAEYRGVIAALRWVTENRPAGTSVIVQGDSKLVINQVINKWRTKSETSMRYVPMVHELAARLDCHLVWIPREFNSVADQLSREAYCEYVKGDPTVLS